MRRKGEHNRMPKFVDIYHIVFRALYHQDMSIDGLFSKFCGRYTKLQLRKVVDSLRLNQYVDSRDGMSKKMFFLTDIGKEIIFEKIERMRIIRLMEGY